ncbi:hypothetical protein QLQ16_02670 [Limnohabitans sp. HM2-2]|uniref:EpsG family protein n=2 Tax=Limnohabitans lacus TaxID=3045173 RepID=A0ABT6X3Q4_9BURK|nr:hypothetical protein [Limnohabitans sp. HM2-2]
MLHRTLIVYVVIIILYYAFGGASFPDYENYITISQKGGYLFSPDEYFAEWGSRWWLKNVGEIIGNHKISIDILVLFIQIYYLAWLLRGDDEKLDVAKLWITIFLGPLLLTTTIRATPVYLLVYTLAATRVSAIKLMIIFMFGLFFHDTALLVFLVYFIAYFIEINFKKSINFLVPGAWLISILMILLGNLMAENIMLILKNLNIGVRDVYLKSIDSPSFLKIAYALFIAVLCVPSIKRKEKTLEDLFLVGLLLLGALTFAVSSTAAIRIFIFAFGVSLIQLIKNSTESRMFVAASSFSYALFFPLITSLMFWDLFRNTN